MLRFMQVQSCGKLRPIDNGRNAGHNELAWATETIITNKQLESSCDWRLAVYLSVLHGLFWCSELMTWPARTGGYRTGLMKPNLVVGIWHPEVAGIRYAIMRAHPFGLAAAVLNFNRLPAPATAIIRQCTATAAAAYFDDTGVLDLARSRGSDQECVGVVYELLGVHLDALKQQPMATLFLLFLRGAPQPGGCGSFV